MLIGGGQNMCEDGQMDARSRARLVIAHEVMKAIRSQDFRDAAGETSLTGEHVIIPALPDDTMGQFFDQLRVAQGPIYIGTLDGDDIALLSMVPSAPPRHAAPSHDDLCPIHRHTELMMVIIYLRATRAPLRCYEVRPSVMLELVDDDRLAIPTGLA